MIGVGTQTTPRGRGLKGMPARKTQQSKGAMQTVQAVSLDDGVVQEMRNTIGGSVWYNSMLNQISGVILAVRNHKDVPPGSVQNPRCTCIRSTLSAFELRQGRGAIEETLQETLKQGLLEGWVVVIPLDPV